MKKLVYLVAPLMCLSTLVSCGDKYYKVSFVKDDGVTVLEEIQKVKVGTNPTFSGEEPTSTKTPRKSHYFEFDGFKDDSGVKLDESYLMPSHDVVFTAQYLELGDEHTVTWKNYDGSTILTDKHVNFESHPIYHGDTPTKEQDHDVKFVFAGWKDDEGNDYSDDYIMPNHDITFTAQFDEQALDGFIYELSEDETYYINCGLINPETEYIAISERFKNKPVKEIKDYAFVHNKSLKHVYIDDCIEKIGKEAFMGCENLQYVKIGKDVNSIGEKAFSDCVCIDEFEVDRENNVYEGECEIIEKSTKKLIYGSTHSTRIPEGVKIIGKNAFTRTTIQSVALSNSVEIIEDMAFYECESLETLTVESPEDSLLTSIGNYAFCGCIKLRTILPSLSLSIGEYAFKGCVGLLYIDFYGDVSSFGKGVFTDCQSLVEIYLFWSSIVPAAGEDLFDGCDLTKLRIVVNSEKISEFKSASGWSQYSDNIFSN